MRALRLAVTMTTVLMVAATSSACGGDSDESRLRRQRWIEDADEICEDENAELAEVATPDLDPFDETLTTAQLDEIADYLARTLEIQDETSERLDDLGLPTDDADDIEDVLEQRERGRDAVELAIESARAGDGEQFVASYRDAATEYDKATRGAREFGLEECGQ